MTDQELNALPGWISPEEGKALQHYAKGKVCLEIGSFKGKSSCFIASTAKSLLCVDTFKADGGGQVQLEKESTFLEFRSNTDKFYNIAYCMGASKSVVSTLRDNLFDFIFIDAMHDYESVKADIAMCLPKLKMGGIMAFHDYGDWTGWDGVTRAVNEWCEKPDHIHGSIAIVIK